MIRRSQWLGAAALLLATGTAAAFFHQRATDAERRELAQATRVARTETELAELRSEMESAQRQNLLAIQRQMPSIPTGTELGSTSAPTPLRTEPATAPIAKKEVTTEEVRDELNVHFYGEAVDTSWSQTARQKFQTRLSDALPSGAKLTSIECKSTMCRAEITQPDLETHQRFVQHAFMSPSSPWDVATMVSLGENPDSGKVTSIVFLAREGQGLSYESEAL